MGIELAWQFGQFLFTILDAWSIAPTAPERKDCRIRGRLRLTPERLSDPSVAPLFRVVGSDGPSKKPIQAQFDLLTYCGQGFGVP